MLKGRSVFSIMSAESACRFRDALMAAAGAHALAGDSGDFIPLDRALLSFVRGDGVAVTLEISGSAAACEVSPHSELLAPARSAKEALTFSFFFVVREDASSSLAPLGRGAHPKHTPLAAVLLSPLLQVAAQRAATKEGTVVSTVTQMATPMTAHRLLRLRTEPRLCSMFQKSPKAPKSLWVFQMG